MKKVCSCFLCITYLVLYLKYKQTQILFINPQIHVLEVYIWIYRFLWFLCTLYWGHTNPPLVLKLSNLFDMPLDACIASSQSQGCQIIGNVWKSVLLNQSRKFQDHVNNGIFEYKKCYKINFSTVMFHFFQCHNFLKINNDPWIIWVFNKSP